MTKQQDFRQTLKNSRPTTAIPEGLEDRILAAVHKEEKHDLAWAWRGRQFGFLGLVTFLIGSLGFIGYAAQQNGVQVVIETIARNRDVLAWQDAAYALLETLPLNAIAVTFTTATLLCLALSIRLPKQKWHLNSSFHVISLV